MKIKTSQDIKKMLNKHIDDLSDYIAENKLPKHIEAHCEGMIEAYMHAIDYLNTIEIK